MAKYLGLINDGQFYSIPKETKDNIVLSYN